MRAHWGILAAAVAAAVVSGLILTQQPATAAPSATPAPALSPAAARTTLNLAHAALSEGDYEKAKALADPLAAKGDPAANHLLGYLFEKGLGVRADIGAALRHYGDAAIAGNADAQVALGLLAFDGDGVYPDYERAAGWFRLAAAQGDARAQVRLGIMHAEGAGLTRNAVAAADYFAKAAAKGDADGAFYLGVAWMNGDGVPQNYRNAARSFEAAAGKGHGEAAYHLALLHDAPALGAPDAAKSARYMRQAAAQGFVPAYAALGLMVHRGDADGTAADWFEKGARAGDPQAALLYAVALSQGDGRAQDIIGALTIADKLIASRTAPDTLKAQAAALKNEIRAKAPGALTLRN